MDTKAAGVNGRANARGIAREWVSPDRRYGGIMTEHADGTRSFELHQDCKLQLCKRNNFILRCIAEIKSYAAGRSSQAARDDALDALRFTR